MAFLEAKRIILPAAELVDPAGHGVPHRPGMTAPYQSIPEALAAYRAGDPVPLLNAEVFGGKDRIGIKPLKYLDIWLGRTETPHVWVQHDPMTLQQKAEMFAEIHDEVTTSLESKGNILPVKTVTLHNGKSPRFVLAVTTLGSQVDNKMKAAIAANLTEASGVPVATKLVKGGRINPPKEVFDASLMLGLEPGVIGPLVTRSNMDRVTRWYYVDEGQDQKTPVELALSQTDSLIMQKDAFERLLTDYEREFLRVEQGFYPLRVESTPAQ